MTRESNTAYNVLSCYRLLPFREVTTSSINVINPQIGIDLEIELFIEVIFPNFCVSVLAFYAGAGKGVVDVTQNPCCLPINFILGTHCSFNHFQHTL